MLSQREIRALQRNHNKLKQELKTVPKLTHSKLDKLKRMAMRHKYTSVGSNSNVECNYCISDCHVKIYNNINDILMKMLQDRELKEFYLQAPWVCNVKILEEIVLAAERGVIVFIRTVNPRVGGNFAKNYQVENNCLTIPNINVLYSPTTKVYKWDNYTHAKNYLFKYKSGDTISGTGSLNSSKASEYNVEELLFTSDNNVFEADVEKYFSN